MPAYFAPVLRVPEVQGPVQRLVGAALEAYGTAGAASSNTSQRFRRWARHYW